MDQAANATHATDRPAADPRPAAGGRRAERGRADPMVEADAPRLSLPLLAVELRHAVASNDVAAQWCWSRAIAPRLAARAPAIAGPGRAARHHARPDPGGG